MQLQLIAQTDMKNLVIGSCLSGLICYEAGFNNVHSYNHLRTDFILQLLGDNRKNLGCSFEEFDIVYEYLSGYMEDKRHKDSLRNRIKSQFCQKLGVIEDLIRCSDVIIFDNNYDLGRLLYEFSIFEKSYLFSNLVNIKPKWVGNVYPALEIQDIKRLQLHFFSCILEINPHINLFYFNYPVTAFEIRASSADLQRVENARAVNAFMKRAISTGVLPEQITFVGCIDLPAQLLSSKGPLYFETEVYRTFGELIKRKMASEAVFSERYFDNFEDLQKRLGFSSKETSVSNPSSFQPYANLPDRQYWKPAVAEPYPLAIADLYRKKFPIAAQNAVATCGSCFAQHIGKRLRGRGYRYLDLEPAPAELKAEQAKALGYGLYSARYGNVYTSRQLLQLFQRAFDRLHFDENWQDKAGRFVDPFRPNLCGEGYATAEAMLDAQREHLQQVRRMFETLDVFVFTMGLTETWFNRETGAVYPICPGVTAGTFDPQRYAFVNLDYITILDEMETFLSALKEINPGAKVLLTVSPVPLTATAADRHVLLSTMASKSILRAIADKLYQRHAHVDYFPSYDIIMSPPYRGMFFKNNLRSIHEEGVDYVMSHFFDQHRLHSAATAPTIAAAANQTTTPNCGTCESADDAEEDDEAFCDEAFLELERNQTAP